MSNAPNDSTPKLDTSQAAQNSAADEKKTGLTANKETAHEAFTRMASGNPRFREVKSSGKGFVIVGAKP